MKNFFESNSFSLVVGMFEKYGSTEEVAIDFCNKLCDCKSSNADVCNIFTEYNARVDGFALLSAIAYLSIFEENCNLYELSDEPYLKWWLGVFYWYKVTNSFRCVIDGMETGQMTSQMSKCIGLLLELGELVLEGDRESGCLNICLNPNNEPVDASKAFGIYKSCMYKPDFVYDAYFSNYDSTISMEEASIVLGSEIVKGNLDLVRVC